MVDLLILVILSWSIWFGWRRGALRTLVDAVALLTPMFLVTLFIPFLKDVLIDRGWSLAVAKFMAGHLVKTSPQSAGFLNVAEATPVAQGIGLGAPLWVERLYELVILGLMSGALFVGLQMVLQVYETLWRESRFDWQARALGGVAGLGIGATVSAYVISVLGLLCWIQGLEWLDQEMIGALSVRSLYRVIFW
jgi:hypothetical protein